MCWDPESHQCVFNRNLAHITRYISWNKRILLHAHMNPLSGQTIVFLPGLDGTGISFEPLGKLLPAGVTVEVITYPPGELLSFEETVCCAMDQIKNDREAIVIAESFSGPVAAALVGSGRLKAKCVIFSTTFARSPRPLLLKLLACLPLELIITLPLPRFLLRHIIAGGEGTADIFMDLAQRIRAIVPAKTLVHRLKVVDDVDIRGLLAKIQIPCLYLQSASDKTVPARCLHDFAAALANLQVARIRGPHFILQAQPGECLAAIEDFLARVP
jgi:pimeloyl-[acyl-carrier protein] methyl ester esterase